MEQIFIKQAYLLSWMESLKNDRLDLFCLEFGMEKARVGRSEYHYPPTIIKLMRKNPNIVSFVAFNGLVFSSYGREIITVLS